MKRLFLLFVALLFAACQTTPPLKDCNTLMKDVSAAHQAAGRFAIESGGEEKLAGAIFWDMQGPTAYLEIIAAEDYKFPEGNDLKEVGACTMAGKGPDAEPTVWKHWQKELPVTR